MPTLGSGTPRAKRVERFVGNPERLFFGKGVIRDHVATPELFEQLLKISSNDEPLHRSTHDIRDQG
jgi:hypothetical protein